MKFTKLAFSAVGVFGLVLASCAPDPFEAEYQALKKDSASRFLLADFLRLDQTYRDRLALKIDLGVWYLAHGAPDEALVYFTKAESLAAASADQRLKTLLWGNLAAYHCAKGEAAQAINYADRAVQDKNESLGAVFTRARAKLILGRRSEALADFQTGWDTRQATMGPADFVLYSRALIEENKDDQALLVLAEYRKKAPYELGTGLAQAECYERTGRLDESVAAGFVDQLYRHSMGLVSRSALQENVSQLAKRMHDPLLNPGLGGLGTLAAVEAYLRGKWRFIETSLPKQAETPDLEFLRLAGQLESGRSADLSSYCRLETVFHDFPSYYLHLLRYLEKSGRLSNPGTVALAEKTIDLSPMGPESNEGRVYLAKVFGLGSDQADRLLTRVEIDRNLANWTSTSATGAPSVGLRGLLETPENPSVQYAQESLTRLAKDPSARFWLASAWKNSEGRTKERLNLVLQSR